jgi:hypothetical protein
MYLELSSIPALGVLVPIPTFEAKYALRVVVAPPEIVRPPAWVPLPIVDEAVTRMPLLNLLRTPENVLVSPRSVDEALLPEPLPTHAPLIAKQPPEMLMPPVELNVDVAVEKLMPFVLPMARSEPGVVEPMPTFPLFVTMKFVAVDDPTTNAGPDTPFGFTDS